MNIELKPIAESKVRQLGGDVCGVLVRKDEKLAAVDEYGRTTWLGDEALFDSIKQRADAWLGLVELLNDLTPEWRKHPGTGRESAFVAIRGLAEAARAQGGQGAEPVAEIVHDYNGISVQWLEPAKYGRFQSGQKLYTQPQPAVPEDEHEHLHKTIELLTRQLIKAERAATQGVPKGYTPVRTLVLNWLLGETEAFEPLDGECGEYWWRKRLREALLSTPTKLQPAAPEETEAMVDAAAKVFEDAGARVDLGWLGEACRAYVAASFTPTTPQADAPISGADRAPTKSDGDYEGKIWIFDTYTKQWIRGSYREFCAPRDSHWMPTGLKRPEAPAEQEGSGYE